MVNATDVYRQGFWNFNGQFTIFRETACSILSDEDHLEFQTTHDLDIVPIAEA